MESGNTLTCDVCKKEITSDEIDDFWQCDICQVKMCLFCSNYCHCGMTLCDNCYKGHKLVRD